MYSYGPPHMAGQKQDDQLKHTSSSYVRIQDVALKTCQWRWTIERSGERGSGISVPTAWHDDDDDDDDDDMLFISSTQATSGSLSSPFINRFREREREREFVCVCLCVREIRVKERIYVRERERERERKKERERGEIFSLGSFTLF